MKINALIVEDNFINMELLKEMLTRLECEVDVAENGKEALKYLEQNKYAIIFMDLQMPEMDGFEATSLIRNRTDEKREIPIIALTANIVPSDKQRCFDVGMNDYLSKPFEVSDLQKVLSKYID